MSLVAINAHKMVADLCEKMAQEVYEELAKRNGFYAMHPDRKAFVKEAAPSLRQEARAILAGMLGDPKVSDKDKSRIHEALILDKTIPQQGWWELPKGVTL
jgi:hypothetical protein